MDKSKFKFSELYHNDMFVSPTGNFNSYFDVRNTLQAAVTIDICENKIPLILRNKYPGVHSEQIGFPGGRIEEGETSRQAAIRETIEEIGFNPEEGKFIQTMPPFFIAASNFMVYPYIFEVDYLPFFKLDPNEVQDLILLPLDTLLYDSSLKQKKAVETSYGSVEVNGYLYQGHFIWGATAIMLEGFRQLIIQKS